MPSREPSLRQQLIEARADVRQQIDTLVLRGGGGGYAPDNSELIAKLTETLFEIDSRLAELEA